MFISLVSFIFLFLIVFVALYNNLIQKKNQVENAFSSVDVILQKRSDLIPRLVTLAQMYMQFEQKILTEISRLRSRASSKDLSDNSRVATEDQISRILTKIIVVFEAYPELKTNEHFIKLQYSLNEVEEQLSAARRFYNSAVTEYNNAVEMFPTNIIASWMKYKLKLQFKANSEARNNVNFEINNK
ncbi:LemA family protein [Nostoc sp. 'Peltigera membranacea cyanobiont' 210A]|uniref:LemA family protein n=1 Tax=Nostoc sp. 'Peltigera membranacea cyanobiont' 210A TaxID=2014529 RepID=UPI000B95892E|nr:LemA family protein [Nostoc sp. 'Peltigera membranacea cyanobiont' 210A]OYD89550.1 LemA family protein [Nostoc sp. 'Peltigera membranacea cyanobiont' 210A]